MVQNFGQCYSLSSVAFNAYGFLVKDGVWSDVPTFINGAYSCVSKSENAYLATFGIMLYQIVILMILTTKVSKIKASIHEFKENMIINLTFLIGLLVVVVIVFAILGFGAPLKRRRSKLKG
jgi:hypothetical protein